MSFRWLKGRQKNYYWNLVVVNYSWHKCTTLEYIPFLPLQGLEGHKDFEKSQFFQPPLLHFCWNMSRGLTVIINVPQMWVIIFFQQREALPKCSFHLEQNRHFSLSKWRSSEEFGNKLETVRSLLAKQSRKGDLVNALWKLNSQ